MQLVVFAGLSVHEPGHHDVFFKVILLIQYFLVNFLIPGGGFFQSSTVHAFLTQQNLQAPDYILHAAQVPLSACIGNARYQLVVFGVLSVNVSHACIY
jgi:hypothetical protein